MTESACSPRSSSPSEWAAVPRARMRSRRRRHRRANALPVSVTTPKTEALARTLVATGSINPWQEAIIGPEVGGYRVAAVNVDVGDKVRKGQELVRLSGGHDQCRVASKRAAQRQAQAQLVNAIAALHRAESLKGSGAVSAAEQERLQSEELAARARVEAAEADAGAAELKLRYTRVAVAGRRRDHCAYRRRRPDRAGRWRDAAPAASESRGVARGSPRRRACAKSASARPCASPPPMARRSRKSARHCADGPQRHAHRPRVRRLAEARQRTSRHVRARRDRNLELEPPRRLPMASIVVRDGYSYVFVVTGERASSAVASRRAACATAASKSSPV